MGGLFFRKRFRKSVFSLVSKTKNDLQQSKLQTGLDGYLKTITAAIQSISFTGS
jgi:hypothetical protein